MSFTAADELAMMLPRVASACATNESGAVDDDDAMGQRPAQHGGVRAVDMAIEPAPRDLRAVSNRLGRRGARRDRSSADPSRGQHRRQGE